jgi:hypothetical protein
MQAEWLLRGFIVGPVNSNNFQLLFYILNNHTSG